MKAPNEGEGRSVQAGPAAPETPDPKVVAQMEALSQRAVEVSHRLAKHEILVNVQVTRYPGGNMRLDFQMTPGFYIGLAEMLADHLEASDRGDELGAHSSHGPV